MCGIGNICLSAVMERVVINFLRVRHNGGKLRTGGVSDHDMRGAAIGW